MPTKIKEVKRDKHGHAIDDKGNLIYDEKCHACDAPKIREGMDSRFKAPRDKAFFSRLEDVLDEHFPKIEEEGEAKQANRRGAALVLFSEAVAIHNHLLALATSEAKREERERIVGMVRGMRITIKNEDKTAKEIWDIADANYNKALSDIASSLESSLEDKE